MKHALLRVCLFSLLITLHPVGAAAKEGLQFTLGKEWKVANSVQTHDYTLLEFVREGDQLDSWKELVTIQNFKKSRDHRSPVATLDELKALREKECPGATKWNVIEQTEDAILYEWHATACLGQPEQHEVARILYGKHNVFLLHYAARVREPVADTRAQWVKWLGSVSVDLR